ncbi:MAG: hypothetical protein IPK71_30835 [Myxococcales bacterium]|nr:hypothetical protein [Myxococcales bacterium]
MSVSKGFLGTLMVLASFSLGLGACAKGAEVADEDESEAVSADAAADTSKPSTTPARDAATDSAPPKDASIPDTATVDATPPPPPPPDASTGNPPATCTDNLMLAKGVTQLAAGDTPPCDGTCRGCCNPAPFVFCVKPIF